MNYNVGDYLISQYYKTVWVVIKESSDKSGNETVFIKNIHNKDEMLYQKRNLERSGLKLLSDVEKMLYL